MSRDQLARAWHIALKDIRTYYLKPPLISWGMLFPAVMILAFYLRSPGDIRALAPGLVALTVLFGATSVEAVVIAFEKRIGAMERLVMAPISHAALLIGKGASGALFGTMTGAIVWASASLALGLALHPAALLVIALGSVAFALLGVLIALLMREVFDAMTVSNFVRFPMIFVCGVFMPFASMAPALRVVATVLPLSYTVDGLRHLMVSGNGSAFHLWLDLVAVAAFAALLYAACYRLLEHRLEELL
ncbi:MAG TPA: ABC transporter permease [Chloroflexi bacterium]|jgi:ABC-2 type transport system permease protein|nr:ABC transporter permease [Chloroflexota bacterium]